MKFRIIASLSASIVALAATNSDAAYDKNACRPGPHDVPNPYPEPDPKAPDHFYFKMPSTVPDASPIILEVNRTWAPIGVDRFYALAKDNYYDCAAFFRVVPDFVVQWGIASDPSETTKWSTAIPDDPVLESNTVGMVSFATAGPGTRTTQIFVNTADNARLDSMGFSPFARVVQGMDEVFVGNHLYDADPVPDQNTYETAGNAWILEEYPEIDIVKGLPQSENGTNTTTEILLRLDEEEETNNEEEQQQEQQKQPEGEPNENDSTSKSTASWITKSWRNTIVSASFLAMVVGW